MDFYYFLLCCTWCTDEQGQPQGSLFTKSTPLMWDLKKAKEVDNSACTKSGLFQQSVAIGGDNTTMNSSQLPSSYIPRDIGSPYYNQHALQASQDYSLVDEKSYQESPVPTGGLHDTSTSAAGGMQLSALQQTLVDCGKLQRADGRHAEKISQEVYKSLQYDIKQTKKHANWLKHKNQSHSQQRPRFQQDPYDEFSISDNAGSFFSKEEKIDLESCDMKHVPPKERTQAQQAQRQRQQAAVKTLRQRASTSTHSSSQGDLSKYKNNVTPRTRGFRGNSSVMNTRGSGKEFDKTSSTTKEFKNSNLLSKSGQLKLKGNYRPPKVTDYCEDMAAHLDVTLVDNSRNPHRSQFRGDSHVKFSSHQSLKVLQQKGIDPKSYSKNNIHTQYGSYNVTVKEPTIRDLPSKEYLSKAMTQISKQMLITYDTRIVETGAALRALQSSKHSSPGIAAILDLHNALIAAAAFNPSTWEVSRQQFEHVMAEQLAWLEKPVVTRLASAYDPQRSGVIKFARMTAALMAGNRPAMSILITNISRDPDKVDDSGNIFLLRLLHSLYEDCDGGVVEEIASTLERDPMKCMRMAKANSNTGID